MKKTVFALGTFIFLISFVVILNASFSANGKCKNISGVVTSIYQAGSKDAVFKLAGHTSVFYINRGLEKVLNLEALLEKLKGKEVNITYADNTTALGSIGESRHISELLLGQELVYSELREK